MSILLLSLYLSHTQVLALPTPQNGTITKVNVNATEPSTVGWVEAPQVRGTFDLLLSCLTTLALCAWTAYHPNVQCSRGFWRQTGHRLTWMLIAVFLPELVLFCAWNQWWATRQLRRSVNELGEKSFGGQETDRTEYLGKRSCNPCQWLKRKESINSDSCSDYNLGMLFQGEEEDQTSSDEVKGKLKEKSAKWKWKWRKEKHESEESKQQTWTMEQAFFAISGGFGVDSSTFSPQRRLTFTAPGLLFLANLGLLPNESPEAVADKSKADYVAKVLVCLQAGWFLIQCIGRVAQKLPLTLLEIHVLTHALCAFAMYLLWIQKPYDVGSPILCNDDRVVNLAALFALHSEEGSKRGRAVCSHTSIITAAQVKRAHEERPVYHSHRRYWEAAIDVLGREEIEAFKGAVGLRDKKSTPSKSSSSSRELEALHLDMANKALEYLRSRNVHLEFEGAFIENPSLIQDSSTALASISHVDGLTLQSALVVPQRSNLQIDGLPHMFQQPPGVDREQYKKTPTPLKGATQILMVLSPSYGALHLTAWSSPFPTVGEQWGWRASALCIIAFPILLGLYHYTLEVSTATHWWRVDIRKKLGRRQKWEMKDEDEEPENKTEAKRARFEAAALPKWKTLILDIQTGVYLTLSFVMQIVGMSSFMIGGACLAVYPFARMFLLAETFAQLRSVEKDVYRTVEWADFIPHAG